MKKTILSIFIVFPSVFFGQLTFINPGFEGMEKFTKKNIAGEIVSFIKLKLGLNND